MPPSGFTWYKLCLHQLSCKSSFKVLAEPYTVYSACLQLTKLFISFTIRFNLGQNNNIEVKKTKKQLDTESAFVRPCDCPNKQLGLEFSSYLQAFPVYLNLHFFQ